MQLETVGVGLLANLRSSHPPIQTDAKNLVGPVQLQPSGNLSVDLPRE